MEASRLLDSWAGRFGSARRGCASADSVASQPLHSLPEATATIADGATAVARRGHEELKDHVVASDALVEPERSRAIAAASVSA
jgi:hypothetical protein